MFKKILIANRGEIACRIIKTCQKMGIYTIAVYSNVDQNSPHVHLADSAWLLGEAEAKKSYLNINAIINIANKAGAEAIHPGYGFLSENANFASACERNNIVFIGPSVIALKTMGSKQLAKQLLANTQVPLIPGYHGKNQSDSHLLNAACNIGFPILLKAASGGGGRGMRIVHNVEEFAQSLASARREAAASFGDDTMLIEKLLINARHIEVQVMADNHGQVVHLFERDCSIQRRHQKIIEEAPAPLLSDTLRQRLTTAACQVATAINYSSAGTVEFLLDENNEFYFIEMNTRLQVEHPITEMITGLDLVAWQLKIAANEPLPCTQNQIIKHGHAIECRIYAEDPQHNFKASIGQLQILHEPGGANIRLDSGVYPDSVISQYYDSMIAKLITWGDSREQALQLLQKSLAQYAIAGLQTNIPFLVAICNNTHFANAQFSTNFLQQNLIDSIVMTTVNYDIILWMAACYDYLTLVDQETDPLYKASFAWQMHLSTQWTWRYFIAEEERLIKIMPINPASFYLYHQTKTIQLLPKLQGNKLTIYDPCTMRYSAFIYNQTQAITIVLPTAAVIVQRANYQTSNTVISTKGQLTAPMSATVVAILKNIGDSVNEGEAIIVLEAMKMEHTIYSPQEAVLSQLFYAVGDQVNEGDELLLLNAKNK